MCDCGNTKKYEDCCEPFLTGTSWPKTAEALMRSRYTAFVRSNIAYIQKTVTGPAAKEFNLRETEKWSKKSEWLGLQILKTERGQEADQDGVVEFVAKYKHENQIHEHHEVSQFKKDSQGHWKFHDGESHVHEDGKGHHHHPAPKQVIREEPKIGRNDACHCGSGKKFKKCHGA